VLFSKAKATDSSIIVGCATMIASRSKHDSKNIIKWQVPLRRCGDFHKMMITIELRNIPANVKSPFTTHKNIKLINIYDSILCSRQPLM
jgi:hypothetical protein